MVAGTSGSTPYFNTRVTNNGTLNVNGNVNFTSVGSQYGNCDFNQGAGSATITGNMTVTASDNTQSCNITFTAAGTINLTGPASTLTLNTRGNVNYGTFAGIIELSGDNSKVNIVAGVLNMGTGNGLLKLSGTIANTGTFTRGSGTVIYQGTTNQTITPLNYFNLASTGTGARTISGTVGIAGDFTKGPNTYTNTGTMNFNGTGAQTVPAFQYNNLTISGARTANVTLDSTDTIKLRGALSYTATYSSGGLVTVKNVISYNGTTAQTVVAFPYNDLTIEKPAGIAATTGNENITVNGNCTVLSGILTIGTGTTVLTQTNEYTFSGKPASSKLEVKDGAQLTLIGNGGYTATFPKTLWKDIVLQPNSTVVYGAGGAQTMANHQYGNLSSAGTGARTLAATGSIQIAGTFTPNTANSTYTVTGSTVDYNGTTNQTIVAFNYNNLTVTNAAANVTLSPTGTVGIAGTFVPNALAFSGMGGSTINYNGTGAQTVIAFNYNNLAVSGARTTNSVTIVATGLIQVAGTLANSATFSSGAFINTGSTIVYNGTTAQSVSDFPYNNLKISKTGPAASLAANLTATNLKGDLSIEQDTLATANFTITGSATKKLAVTDLGVLTISGTTATFPTGFTTVALDPKSWVVYASTAAQTVAAQNYGNLKSTSTGARTLAATGTVGIATDFVSGTNTYTVTGSTVSFNGDGDQRISGNLGTTNALNNLTVNNTGTLATNGLTLTTNLTVAGVLNLNEGLLTLNGKTLILSNAAVGAAVRTNGVIVSESADNSSKVQWNIGTTMGEHVFPFGKSASEYVPFKFNLTSGDASNITVSTYGTNAANEPLPVSPAITGIDQQGNTDTSNTVVDRFWNVAASTAVTRTATLTFDFLPGEKPSTFQTPRVQSWNGTAWDVAPANQTATGNSVSVEKVGTFSTFAIYDNTVPVAAFTANLTTGCIGSSIQFTDLSTPDAVSWNWSFPGGTPSTSTVKNPVVVYSTNGVHDVSLQVSNHYGNTSVTKTGYMTIATPVAPVASSNGPVCTGNPINLMAGTVDGATYSWTGPNGFSSTQQNPVIASAIVAAGGTYSVTSKKNGCTSVAGTTNVTVNQTSAPSVSISNNSPSNIFCSGTTVTYTAKPVNGGSTPSYQWKVDGVNAGTDSPTFSSSTFTNNNTISCTITSSQTCATPATATASAMITIYTTVTPTITIYGNNEICSGTPVTFTAATAYPGTSPYYQWKINGVNAGESASTFTSSNLNNASQVSCEMTSNANCVTSSKAVSNAIEMSVTPSVTPKVTIQSAAGSTPLCAGETFAFTATGTNGGSDPVYDWKVNNVSTGINGTTFSSSSFNNMDKITCTLTTNATCATAPTATSTPSVVYVKPVPSKPQVSQNGLLLTSDQVNGNQWYKNGASIASANQQIYMVTTNGSYTVVASLNGCMSPSSDAVVINTVGIGELSTSGIVSIGPNPTSGSVSIKPLTSVAQQFTVAVYNSIGELVYSGNQDTTEIDFGSKSPGVYTVHLQGTGFSFSQKIIRQ